MRQGLAFHGLRDGFRRVGCGWGNDGAELVRRDKCAAEQSVRTYCFVVGGIDCRILSWELHDTACVRKTLWRGVEAASER